ncbi:NAD(P)/FAD-dependent oxidoreductase [Enemella sp. A6]|uniref:NAD(P)/FAD-dependent oxidoreductase n=1 Tax=Enemella sp. A6 TaxID=3440152 RepID=UPI003EBF717B
MTDVAVVGGGLLGSATAYLLTEQGADVALFEQSQLNSGASGQNAGSLHFQLEYRMLEGGWDKARQAAEAIPLHLESHRLWTQWGELFGERLGVVTRGGLMVAENEQQAELLDRKAALERSWGLDVQTLTGRRLREFAPYLAADIPAAAFCPLEGKANTRAAGPTLAAAAARQGAAVHVQREVRSITRRADRWAVRWTSADGRGEVLVDAVVLAAGVWCAGLAEQLGCSLPIIPLALTMMVTDRRPFFLPHLVQHVGRRLSLKQTTEGNVLIGGGWPARLIGDDDPAAAGFRGELIADSVGGNAAAATATVPSLRSTAVLRSWVGVTAIAPDQLPLVGALPGSPGIFIATGGSAFTLGPGFAAVLVQLISGQQPDLDIQPYSPQRFVGAA